MEQNTDTKDYTTSTILSTVQDLLSQHGFSVNQPTHPFASAPGETASLLNRIIEESDRMSHALGASLALPPANPKVISLYRQHATLSSTLHLSELSVKTTLDALRKRAGITYGEDIPLDRASIVGWCVSRLEAWGASAGMEAFKEEEREGRMTVVLGGKVLVIDIDLAVDRTDPDRPSVTVASVKTSYAIPNVATSSTTQGSASLDGFLANCVQAFLTEVQREPREQDSVEAARLGALCSESLKYLMTLDQLALDEGEGGLRWFSDIDVLAQETEKVAVSEAQGASSCVQVGSAAPLDVFLMRAHSLPLPYLTGPSVSFLVFIAPLTYLTLLRSTSSAGRQPQHSPSLPKLDVPFDVLRPRLTSHPRPRGVTVASLVLSSAGTIGSEADSMNIADFSTRPTFPLSSTGAQVDRALAQVSQVPGTRLANDSTPPPPIWVLDFTEGGKYPGVVMSQSRMREIELLMNPLSGMDQLHSVHQMAFGMGSWLDLLVSNPSIPISPERYTASYISPTSAHPPLQLRLTAPEEPGFILERVPVKNLKEIWGVLEIVKEQCWLNETLSAYQWIPEGLENGPMANEMEDDEANEEDLQAVLTGSLTPRRIPVNLYLTTSAPVSLFDAPDLSAMPLPQSVGHARILMSSPERPPMPGQVEIAVTFDPSKPRGVALVINGAMGAELNTDVLEEVCRRGGTLGLPGRIWAKSLSAS
ncbi:uncharacterized protein B0H18DRAFT_881353 [Fomitopsis serialis]|uniref:uncharacterized protein n=1 Tax=Fomitopsis serialis TaxID=139415 RepID=UPI0020085116|nr:uncharacterized protein B0H18DRAFT_881353 [Neoantrodia serialis]KAH9920094.1 hypothetical protein B0H18DRAFT_881353 [Neoantrodia serialis]